MYVLGTLSHSRFKPGHYLLPVRCDISYLLTHSCYLFPAVAAAAFTATLVWALPTKHERLGRAQLSASVAKGSSGSGACSPL